MNIKEYFENKKILKEIKKRFELEGLEKEMPSDQLLRLTKKYNAIENLIETAPNPKNTDVLSKKKREVIESSILYAIQDMPELLKIRKHRPGYMLTSSIGNRALNNNFFGIVKHILQDPIGCINTDENGWNLAMDCAEAGYPLLAELSLNNETARTQQNNEGNNIGMILIDSTNNVLSVHTLAKQHKTKEGLLADYESAIIKALSHDDCSLQQNKEGMNMGMLCAENILLGKRCFWEATKNEEARAQVDQNNETMCDKAIKCGYNEEELKNRTGFDSVTSSITRFKKNVQDQLCM